MIEQISGSIFGRSTKVKKAQILQFALALKTK